jgi:hypothetical protein
MPGRQCPLCHGAPDKTGSNHANLHGLAPDKGGSRYDDWQPSGDK